VTSARSGVQQAPLRRMPLRPSELATQPLGLSSSQLAAQVACAPRRPVGRQAAVRRWPLAAGQSEAERQWQILRVRLSWTQRPEAQSLFEAQLLPTARLAAAWSRPIEASAAPSPGALFRQRFCEFIKTRPVRHARSLAILWSGGNHGARTGRARDIMWTNHERPKGVGSDWPDEGGQAISPARRSVRGFGSGALSSGQADQIADA
jgi:hypothetical protein